MPVIQTPLSNAGRWSTSIIIVLISAILFVALRAEHVRIVFLQTGSTPFLLLAIFWLCSFITLALFHRSKIAWYAARILSGYGILFFTLGLLSIANLLVHGRIQDARNLLPLTLLNPATSYTLFFSLGCKNAKQHFCGTGGNSTRKAFSRALLGSLFLTGSLYATIRFHSPEKYTTHFGSTPSISFEIREASLQPVEGFAKMTNRGTGTPIYIHPVAEFSNKDVCSTSVANNPSKEDATTPTIIVSFTEEAAHRFAGFTARCAPPAWAAPIDSRRRIAVLVDGQVWFAATTSGPITGGRCFVPCPSGDKQYAVRIAKGIMGQGTAKTRVPE